VAINTYATLQEAIANWLASDIYTDRIPEFIALAEAKFNRDLRSNLMETRATATVDTGSSEPEFIALPGDFQTMRRVRLSSVTGKPRLLPLTGQQADDFRYGSSNATGQPVYFTIFGDEMELLPTPDAAYTIEMVYRANIDALADDNTTNWLLAAAPDAYLYGALMEASAFKLDDARIPTWATAYKYAIDSLNQLAQDQIYGAGQLQVRMTGVMP
jgi:hypothetical protein